MAAYAVTIMSSPNHTSPTVAFAVAALGIGTFSLMDAAMKDLALAIGAYNAVLWRNALGSVIMGVLFLATRRSMPKRAVLKLHLWRSAVVAAMAISFFWSLTVLPLAEAIGLSFIAPVIALYLAAVLLGEKIGREAVIASVAGLVGVVIILAGKFSGDYSDESRWGAVAVLFSAVVFAYNLILARQQAQQAGPIEIAFFQNLFTAAILALAAPWFFSTAATGEMPMIAAAAGLAIISLLLLSWAYARAEAQVLIPVEYTAFVWAAICGWAFFAEPVTVTTLAGTALIVGGSLVAARTKPKLVEHTEITAA